jgi:hypothetical protein
MGAGFPPAPIRPQPSQSAARAAISGQACQHEIVLSQIQRSERVHGLWGTQSVLQAAKVGQMLIELKSITAYREFQTRVSGIGIDQRQSSRLMTVARDQQLLEQYKPDSQRAAQSTRLPPPVPALATQIGQFERLWLDGVVAQDCPVATALRGA